MSNSDNVEVLDKCKGKIIHKVEFNGGRLALLLNDNVILEISDDGQSCCEKRYITCDDIISDLIGTKFLDVKEKGRSSEENGDWGDVHETMFVDIVTDKITITLVTHNEHNGWYGGFSLKLNKIDITKSIESISDQYWIYNADLGK